MATNHTLVIRTVDGREYRSQRRDQASGIKAIMEWMKALKAKYPVFNVEHSDGVSTFRTEAIVFMTIVKEES